MPVELVHSLDDPRVAIFGNLKDRALVTRQGKFIAEGQLVVDRLLDSDHPVEAILCDSRRREAIERRIGPDTMLYVADAAVMDGILGFAFHRGMLACGRRPVNPPLGALLPTDAAAPARLLICPEVFNHENVGSLVRIAAAMGANGVLLGERSCDPFYRRSIRVSMGSVFHLPVRVSEDFSHDLRELREAHGLSLVATVTDADATPLWQSPRPARVGIVLGSESQGLPRHWVEQCDQRVTIPMHHGTDSLNISVAAAVFLYHHGVTRGQ